MELTYPVRKNNFTIRSYKVIWKFAKMLILLWKSKFVKHAMFEWQSSIGLVSCSCINIACEIEM